jgi:hypothetical protein
MFERDKLRTDVSHANKRASLIAAEIDENYTKIESSIQTQIKLVEDKHAEAMKQLNEALNAEREQLVALSVKYEAEVSRYQESIAELTNEMAEKQKVSEALEPLINKDFRVCIIIIIFIIIPSKGLVPNSRTLKSNPLKGIFIVLSINACHKCRSPLNTLR